MNMAMHDDTSGIENRKLLYANSYRALVHGLDGLGAAMAQPEPYSWMGWTLIQHNGAWAYRNKSGAIITPAELHVKMGGIAQEHIDHTIPGYAKTTFASGWGFLGIVSLVMLWPEIKRIVRG